MRKEKQARPPRQPRAPRTAASAQRARNARLWIAGGVALALVGTIAVVAHGYDARETPREEPGVWVARDAGQYARVNTDTGEIDLVRKISEPSGVTQVGNRSLLLSHGNGRAWAVEAANPLDLSDSGPAAGDAASEDPEGAGSGSGTDAQAASNSEAPSAISMPDGTRDVVTEGRFVAVRTESGGVYVGEIAPSAPDAEAESAVDAAADVTARLESLTPVDPLAARQQESGEGADGESASDEGTNYQAAAVAVSADGIVALYSADDRTVDRYDLAKGEFVGGTDTVAGRAATAPQLAFVGSDWVLLDAESGRLWRAGAGARAKDVPIEAPAKLQASGSRGDGSALIADSAGLLSVPKSGAPVRTVEAEGVPAQPIELGDTRFAAWLGASSGTLWTGEGSDTQPLQFDDSVETGGDWEPSFLSNGDRAVLGDKRTGMLWTLPDGAMIPLTQWTISDPPKENRGEVVVDEVTEQFPPTAMPDAFGVRAGEPAPLPVLLNDFDPNTSDVLTILPESLTENPLTEDFGTLQIAPDGQSLMVQPSAGITGSATFSYRVTDGVLRSEPAVVTLTVADDATNTAPAWCPVEGCQRTWGVPAIVPGGTLVTPLLESWVDPEGDVMMLADARPAHAEDPVRVLVTADGRLALRHTDPNAGASDIMLMITVRDSRGLERQRELQVQVQPDALAQFTDSAATVTVGQPLTLRPLERVAGGSGSFALTDAAVQSGDASVTRQLASGTIVVEATQPGVSNVSVSVQDTGTGAEITGTIRVTAVTGSASLTLPPLRAFVRPLSDTTVEVLGALPGADSRALSVVAADVLDGELRADIIEHSRVRVAGSTANGAAGRIGAVDVTVAEDERRGHGRLTVFQVPESGASATIAVADNATVRAGSVVDIPVLANDVGAPGERLLLHPDVSGSGTKGELAFASGSVLRYLAPEAPGTYRVNYTAYGASAPDESDVGTVVITVTPKAGNRDPKPATLTARLSPGENTSVHVPLSGVDPDGDRVRLVGVAAVEDPQVTASISVSGAELAVSASETAKPGVRTLKYEVKDGAGGAGEGVLRVIVTDGSEASGAPIAVTDVVRLMPGADPAVVTPLSNDIDPARGRLSLESIVPNVPGGTSNPDYKRLADRLDAKELEQGRVTVKPGSDLGVVSYKYRVTSSATKSTADGLVVVQTSERVGTQAPSITDTVLNVRDRARLTGEGVDVLTGKVRWATGDPSSLSISIWQENGGDYRVEGTRILGSYNPDGDTVVFKATGVDTSGTKVSSYGFLVIPSLDELRVTLKPGLGSLRVDEEQSVDARVSDLVDVGPEDRVEVRQGSFPVSRANARCEAVSADSIRYRAGKEAPWADICLMDVRLRGQKQWTTLPVPVAIVPKDPQAELRPLTRTIAPGESESIALADMVEWPGGRQGDASKLRFSVSGGGALFEVQPGGANVTATAKADARPGAQEALTVNVSGAGEASSTLTLRVGEAARDLPRGGTVALRCTVGASCSANVVGVPGEYDPFAGKSGGGLKLASVDSSSCNVGSFAPAGDTSVAVSWPGGRTTGGTCTVGFTVRDAQGRTGSGTIEFDAQGIPEAPASISQIDYSDSSATFSVTLTGRSHPAVTDVRLSGAGSTSCSPAGPSSFTCVATGLRNGEKHQFSARAVNAVGESAPSSSVTAWAYKAPPAPEVSAEPVRNQSNEDQTKGALRIRISGSTDSREYQVSYGGQSLGTLPGPSVTREFPGLPAGPNTVVVVPVTAFEVPPIKQGSSTGDRAEVAATVIGAPKISGANLVSTGNESARVEGTGTAHAGESISLSFNVEPSNKNVDCRNGGSQSRDFSGLEWRKEYHGAICAKSDYGRSIATTGNVRIGNLPDGISGQYTVNPAPQTGGNRASYKLQSGLQALNQSSGTTVVWRVDGGSPTTSAPSPDEAAIRTFEVRQCTDPGDEGTCSPWGPVTPTNGVPALASVQPNGQCFDAASPPANPMSLFTVSPAASGYATGVAGTPDANAKTIPITISWSGAFGNLQQVTLNACYKPPPAQTPTTP
ncbi:Ig-like domain-containing protein [Leucobacter luti]|uniref:Ig-like domain-containing protein n=1 Tax=Leucobacter luti TaxID=340320 RepID=UPI003D028FA1